MNWKNRKLLVFGFLGLLLAIASISLFHLKMQEKWGRSKQVEIEKVYHPQIVQLTDFFRKGPPAKGPGVADAPELAALVSPGLLGAYLSYDTEKILRFFWFQAIEENGFRGHIVMADNTTAIGKGTVNVRGRGPVPVVTYSRKGTDAAGRAGEICLVVEE